MPAVRFLRGQEAVAQIRHLGKPYLPLLPYFENDFSAVIRNSGECRMELMGLGEKWIPLVINPGTRTGGHLHSTHAYYIQGASDAILSSSLPKLLRRAVVAGLQCIDKLACFRKLDRCVLVNCGGQRSWFSPPEHVGHIPLWLPAIQKRFPGHAIRLSPPPHLEPEFFGALEEAGFQMIVSGGVYYWKPAYLQELNRKRRQNFRRDLGLLDDLPFDHLTEKDDLSWITPEDLRRLYASISLEKYSRLNPDFSTVFFEHLLERKPYLMEVFRREGELVAFSINYTASEVLHLDLIGYREVPGYRYPAYRPMVMLGFKKAQATGCLLHLGPGSGEFKSNRGARQRIEHRAVYTHHLSLRQRLRWCLLRWMYEIFAPFMIGRITK
jgi:hypothetical protein